MTSPTVDAFAKVNAVLARIQRISHDAAAMSGGHATAIAETPAEQQHVDNNRVCDHAAAAPPGVVLGSSPRPPGGPGSLDGSVTSYSALARNVHSRSDRPAAPGHEPEHLALSSALLSVGRRGSLPLHPTRRLTAVSESAAVHDLHGLSHGGRYGDEEDEDRTTAAEHPAIDPESVSPRFPIGHGYSSHMELHSPAEDERFRLLLEATKLRIRSAKKVPLAPRSKSARSLLRRGVPRFTGDDAETPLPQSSPAAAASTAASPTANAAAETPASTPTPLLSHSSAQPGRAVVPPLAPFANTSSIAIDMPTSGPSATQFDRVASTTLASSRNAAPQTMGEHARLELIEKYAALSEEDQAALLRPDDRVVLPLLYPVNINTWGTLRQVLHDFGREYSTRISFYCMLFFLVSLKFAGLHSHIALAVNLPYRKTTCLTGKLSPSCRLWAWGS